MSRICFAKNGSSRERTLDPTQQNIQLLTQSTSQNLWCLGADWETYFLCCTWNYLFRYGTGESSQLYGLGVLDLRILYARGRQRFMQDADWVLRHMRAKRLRAGYRPQQRSIYTCADLLTEMGRRGSGAARGRPWSSSSQSKWRQEKWCQPCWKASQSFSVRLLKTLAAQQAPMILPRHVLWAL